ncbi:DUF3301 domain-containing protein [Rhodanobacter sp. 7MK24]|uniref:DUF3301 domain-containing protein n=1 Tax=Rhodanobacter sp. 7MK24 TaxID=2775922 RepID=UPI00177E5F72|nr:DUF3301 domain-containing protein [Rhodanobacter sp. 7MK24]MBD8880511.1 DUF3301 domain-containing protein [Rhodanobacter sp. 7MK24]
MGNIHDLLILLALVAAIALWLKLSAARDRAATEARLQCERYGLQMLDESVGLRALRLRRVAGRQRLERCYGFEVSIDGADREQASLWVLGDTLSELRLPTVVLSPSDQLDIPAAGTETWHPPTEPGAPHADGAAGSNVIPLRPRRRSSGGNTLH